MKRIRIGVGNRALVVVASLAAGASSVYGCIPDPDISALPPFDASTQPGFDANSLIAVDAGPDAVSVAEAGDDGPANDGPSSTTGTVSGVVINYAQGNGKGVIPGATVTALTGQTTTTNAFGAFVLTGVPAGKVQLTIAKATDKTAGIAYSTTQVVLTLAGNQDVSVFPVLHQGCFETVNLASSTQTTVSTSDVGITCAALGSQPGVFAGLAYSLTSFVTPSNGANFAGVARFEIIPIAFPSSGASTDFTWALGLPGATTPIETIGAAEFRVVDDSSNEPLAIHTGDTSVVATVTTMQTANTTTFAPYFYDTSAGAWSAETGAVLSNPSTTQFGDGPLIDVVNIGPLKDLKWLSVTSAAAPTSCVTGSVTVNGAPQANVWVHGTGLNYFGSSSAVTDSNGSFCIDVKAAPGGDAGDAGATPQVGIAAGYATTGGAFLSLPTSGFLVSSLAGGSCATKSGCTAIGAVTLAPFNSGCVNGTLTRDDGGTVPSTLNVQVTGLNVSVEQSEDGIENFAYVGTATVGVGGAFCAEAPAGAFNLIDPASTNCFSPSLTALSGGSAAICGGGGCIDAGARTFSCH